MPPFSAPLLDQPGAGLRAATGPVSPLSLKCHAGVRNAVTVPAGSDAGRVLSRWLLWVAGFVGVGLAGPASAQFFEEKKYGDKFEEARVWIEGATELPAFPEDGDLIAFTVSAATKNAFFVDAKSIRPGADGVVRFSLVVISAGGATNVSHEGIRCDTRQRRLYAIGRSDRTWVNARDGRWSDISGAAANRQHAALARDFFCPGGSIIRTADEGVSALRHGGHPEAVK